jgi:hypothetical protein
MIGKNDQILYCTAGRRDEKKASLLTERKGESRRQSFRHVLGTILFRL